MKRLTSLLSASVLMCSAGMAFAGSDSGLYIGGSVGSADVDYSQDINNVAKIKVDDDDTAYKGFIGYNLGLIPFLNLAVEGSYLNFGTQDGEINNIRDVELEVTGWSGAGLVGFDLGPIGVFGKLGFVSWDSDVDTNAGGDSDSGTDPMYGLGAKIQLGSFAIRAEYELFDLEDADIDFFSVGASYTF